MNLLRNEKVFSIVWNKGHMELNVGEFFGKANQNEVKKMFRLIMRKYCTEEQRSELIELVNFELKSRERAAKDINDLEFQIDNILCSYNIPMNTKIAGTKDLEKQCERLKKALALLKEERW